MMKPKQGNLLSILMMWWCLLSFASAAEKETIRILSFNIWQSGKGGKQPFEQTVEVVKKSQADVVGLQESSPDSTKKLAEALGWHHFNQGGNTAVISRFEIVDSTPNQWGVQLKLPSGRKFYVFNAHFSHAPYQPYQLVGIPYTNSPPLSTAEEAVQSAKQARGGQVSRMLAEFEKVQSENALFFVTGDFNEPSHLDWTSEAVKAGHCPVEVKWPTTSAVMESGFVDAYRSLYPDPVKDRGLTWTNMTRPDDPKDKHDRIDFVFVKGAAVQGAGIVGESKHASDIVVSPYPSDHRAVWAQVEY